ncbi:DUF305 domain-containing protein [Pimelobacter simplex]|jgi:uncharacterized protein (DUF305 family)|uniref:DUF305 domain-containing protein n=2 Tax=Nocardioides TaxID=1839 RepID=A0ABT8FHL8_9ACTN|nr:MULTISPECIES: DUF305 domain-containing protein [Nocardioides]MDN4174181.1 DUF305 domain-containing protein [Nocardioides oceani]
MRKTLTAAIVAASLLTLAACGNEDGSDSAAGHNDADVAFAQQMIPHHQQAVEMAQLAETRAESPEVKDLAADIEAAQDPEIETMTGWLDSWGEEVPGDGGHGGHDMSSDDMAGMMSEEEMADLEGSSGSGFDQMFLTMMIEHHEGAIEMAQTEQTEGEFPDALALAGEIESAQTEEIQTMQELLKP